VDSQGDIRGSISIYGIKRVFQGGKESLPHPGLAIVPVDITTVAIARYAHFSPIADASPFGSWKNALTGICGVFVGLAVTAHWLYKASPEASRLDASTHRYFRFHVFHQCHCLL